MEFKKHDWRTFEFKKQDGLTGEISIMENGRKVDRFIFNDKENYKRIIKLIKQKYGFSPEETKEEEKKAIQKEIDFLTGEDFKGEW